MKYFFLFFLFASVRTLATTQDSEPMGSMNGISFESFFGFEKKWELITVRYRTDTGEQRFSYGNPIAVKALREGKGEYPDGAIFGKIGIGTEEDPHFTSSKVPGAARRIQFMVKDKKRYASTGGWGYALFKSDGIRLNEPVKEQSMACFACHDMVKDQGYVFSKFMSLSGKTSYNKILDDVHSKLQIVEKKKTDLKLWLSKHMKSKVSSLSFIEGALRENTFVGTYDEITPSLIAEVKKMNRPAIFLNRDENFGVIVMKEADSETKAKFPIVCSKNEELFLIFQNPSGSLPEYLELVNRVCVKKTNS